jgi:UDP-2,4-diacetamido-2,4,6-trideoxy-beta-L-altropyranose hydrolase
MRLFIRTEASNAVGMGHFMRCFAIGEEARTQGFGVTFLMSEPAVPVSERAGRIGAEIEVVGVPVGADLAMIQDLALPNDWLLVDSYKATGEYIRALSKLAHVGVVDDLNALEAYDCDLIVNPALAADEALYRSKSQAQLLLGAPYALIRREFTQDYPATDQPFVAVLFGGSDPNQLTGRSALMLSDALPDVSVKVIAGPAHIHVEALHQLEKAHPHIKLYVNPPSVAEVLTGAELVITAAGGSVGEMAAMGLPALALVVYDNQAAALQQCPYPVIDIRQGLPDDLGAQARALYDNLGARTEMARSAHALVDGKGAWRVVEAMKEAGEHV